MTSAIVTLTCPVCEIAVNQTQGTRRTICPHCGNFYDTTALAPTPRNQPRLLEQRHRTYPTSDDDQVYIYIFF